MKSVNVTIIGMNLLYIASVDDDAGSRALAGPEHCHPT